MQYKTRQPTLFEHTTALLHIDDLHQLVTHALEIVHKDAITASVKIIYIHSGFQHSNIFIFLKLLQRIKMFIMIKKNNYICAWLNDDPTQICGQQSQDLINNCSLRCRLYNNIKYGELYHNRDVQNYALVE